VADYFPAFLDLRGRRCLVVGGGPIGERKARDLLACQASVVVVTPRLTAGLAALVADGLVAHRPRGFRRSDTRGCAVVVAATGEPALDAAVAAAARRRHALVNVVDDAAHCDFIVPSVLRRGQLQIAVSTGGRSPALARDIRRRLEPLFDADFGAVVEAAGRERARARAVARTPRARRAAGERTAAGALNGLRAV
jgi:precorrin-2 dehydrogenase/sirohydrochlorin ferrochelatase